MFDPSRQIGGISMPRLAENLRRSLVCHPLSKREYTGLMTNRARRPGQEVDYAAGKKFLGGGGRPPAGGAGRAAGRRRPLRTPIRPGAGRGNPVRAVHGWGGPGGLRGASPPRGRGGRGAERPAVGTAAHAARGAGRPAPRPAGVRGDGGGGVGPHGGGTGADSAGLLRPGGAGGAERYPCGVSGMVTVGRGGECPGSGPARAFRYWIWFKSLLLVGKGGIPGVVDHVFGTLHVARIWVYCLWQERTALTRFGGAICGGIPPG